MLMFKREREVDREKKRTDLCTGWRTERKKKIKQKTILYVHNEN